MTILSFLGNLITGPSGLAVGQLGLALVSWFIQKSEDNAAARGRFLDLVQHLEAQGSIPAGLYAKYGGLVQSADAKADAELAKEKAAQMSAEKFVQGPPKA